MSPKYPIPKFASEDMFAFKNGVPVIVGRPAHDENKKASLALSKVAAETNDPDKLQEAIEVGGPYVMIGYLSKDGKAILDDKGNVMPTVLEPGDTFLDPRGVQKIDRAEA